MSLRPLTKRDLFQLVADEAFRDGLIDSAEAMLLAKLGRLLGLSRDEARALASVSRARYETGHFEETRPMDIEHLYVEALQRVLADGRVGWDERRVLAGLRKLLGIAETRHRELVGKVLSDMMRGGM